MHDECLVTYLHADAVITITSYFVMHINRSLLANKNNLHTNIITTCLMLAYKHKIAIRQQTI